MKTTMMKTWTGKNGTKMMTRRMRMKMMMMQGTTSLAEEGSDEVGWLGTDV
jgi:hypothetical protein